MQTKRFIIMIGILIIMGVTLIYSAVIPTIPLGEKEFIVLPNVGSIKVGKIVNGVYVPGAILPESGSVRINLLAIPDPANASWPATARWYYKRTNDSDNNYAEIGSLSNTSFNFTSGGSWTIKAKSGSSEKLDTVFIIDQLKINKEVDAVIKGINTKLGTIEVLGNNEQMPDFLKSSVKLKITAPKLSKDGYELVISNGVAEVVFTPGEIIPSDGLNNAVINAILDGMGDVLTANNTFTSVIIDKIKILTPTYIFKPNENVLITVNLLPAVASTITTISQSVNNLIVSCMKIKDVNGIRNFGSPCIIGNSAGFVVGPAGTRNAGDAELFVKEGTDLWNAYGSEIREVKENYTVLLIELRNSFNDSIKQFLTIEGSLIINGQEIEIEVNPKYAAVSITDETAKNVIFLSYDAEKGILYLKGKENCEIGENGGSIQVGIIAAYNGQSADPLVINNVDYDATTKAGLYSEDVSAEIVAGVSKFSYNTIIEADKSLQVKGFTDSQRDTIAYGGLKTSLQFDQTLITAAAIYMEKETVNMMNEYNTHSISANLHSETKFKTCDQTGITAVVDLGYDEDISRIGTTFVLNPVNSEVTVSAGLVAASEILKGSITIKIGHRWSYKAADTEIGLPGASVSGGSDGFMEFGYEFLF